MNADIAVGEHFSGPGRTRRSMEFRATLERALGIVDELQGDRVLDATEARFLRLRVAGDLVVNHVLSELEEALP